MNKIDAGSISVYARQMVGLAATAEIKLAVLLFVLLCCFTTDIKLKRDQYIHPYIIPEDSKALGTFLSGIYPLLFPLSFLLYFIFSLASFFLSFFLSLCLSKTHRIASFSTTRETKTKISQCRPLPVVLKEIFSSSDNIK